MFRGENRKNRHHELDEYDKAHINEIFFEDMVAKLRKMDARVGSLNCGFAGEAYKNWILYFRSRGPVFEIVDFEYDEDSRGLGLDL